MTKNEPRDQNTKKTCAKKKKHHFDHFSVVGD